MPKNWKWKAMIVLFATVYGIYLLVPTVFHMDKIREDSVANGTKLPLYVKLFPDKALNLGLDLKGGIYIEMEIDVPNAIKRKADVYSSDIEAYLNDKKMPFDSITQPAGDGKLHIRSKTNAEAEEIKGVVRTQFEDLFAIFDTTVENGMPAIIIGFTDAYKDHLTRQVTDQAVETIRNRIDRYGVAEPSIMKIGGTRISIELPGVSDPEQAINIIKKTGQLEFKLVDEKIKQPELISKVDKARKDNDLPDNYSEGTVRKINEILAPELPENREIAFELQRDPVSRKVMKGTPFLLDVKAEVTGDMLQNANVNVRENEPFVELALDKRGTKLFAELTKNNVDRRLAIVLDGNVMSAPSIKEPIPSGRAQITLGYGNYNVLMKEAEELVYVLQEGALPATMHEATKTVVGPTLGSDSIREGLRASIIAGLVIILFMVIYYKVSGVWADIALIVNVILLLAILSLFQATLTLPGIAGIVLTVGMAVDANVIINERIKEELDLGKTPKAAIDSGYKNAFSAVFDSNITTLIAGIILYQFGTGPIRGFAVTLCAGILTTLFTAIIITRLIFDWRVTKGTLKDLSI